MARVQSTTIGALTNTEEYDPQMVRRGWLTVAVLATLAGSPSSVTRASAYTPPELPWANCSGDIAANETVIEARALPEEGATVAVGTPITFSTPSNAPVTFSVASSRALLASPDIDQGVAQAAPSEGGATDMQVFTSTKAASAPGTVYWQASFSAAEVPECAGVLSGPVTAPARILTVKPAPLPQPEPPLVPVPVPTFKATISSVATSRPRVAFQVHCSTTCVGEVAYAVTAIHRGRMHRERGLGFGPSPVSIASPTGGAQQFAHRYTGASLRKLEHLIRGGYALDVLVTSTVTDARGDTAVAHTVARLG